ncbi:retrotransposon hot spot (RHS) protein [Trypanosoma rangeli]|uniref:Retrotransposon hot spot (RHS) protein n=1 Tax=Trypanosoma rangeli TaxID=5698 RepID=A0A422MZ83_TRYRA|nr:retrotransposon hot spot (RHS) protein [Trypanosoma rangeli]RNE98532.1 retrotransposon hot spot (RHS) protein [Trypanosoma rangeli]|eukprot:RNE98532.1 retrotransposon hot spot (RHS) protein [Trypanosoma rangeli]
MTCNFKGWEALWEKMKWEIIYIQHAESTPMTGRRDCHVTEGEKEVPRLQVARDFWERRVEQCQVQLDAELAAQLIVAASEGRSGQVTGTWSVFGNSIPCSCVTWCCMGLCCFKTLFQCVSFLVGKEGWRHGWEWGRGELYYYCGWCSGRSGGFLVCIAAGVGCFAERRRWGECATR